MSQSPRVIRVFISSPGDVNDERSLARSVIKDLRHPAIQEKLVSLRAVAWDDPDQRTPMLATLTPQEAINRNLATPSGCDIVLVILWSRMGTPLPDEFKKPDGSPYLSGTEWEFLDAVNASEKHPHEIPRVVVYRRTEKVLLDASAADFDARAQQYTRVKQFFAAFRHADGSIIRGFNEYVSPAEFRKVLETDLKNLIDQILKIPPDALPPAPVPPDDSADIDLHDDDEPAGDWQGSPFPGLRAFTPPDAPVFFGREAEIDDVLKRLESSRLIAVVGTSGSGKSSLVGAGVIPRLKGNPVEGSKDWLLPEFSNDGARKWVQLRFTPGEVGDNPFMALALAFSPLVETSPRDIAADLFSDPKKLSALCDDILKRKRKETAWAKILLFIDQFEEVFTLVSEQYRQPFMDLLVSAAEQDSLRVILTLRSDYYEQCLANNSFAPLLRSGTYALSTPQTHILNEMITRPADYAGLNFERNLPVKIVQDAGTTAGALALMAYALDELYQACEKTKLLTFAAYEATGGVQKAIGTRAEKVFQSKSLSDDARATLPRVFRALVEINDAGALLRRRAKKQEAAPTPEALALVDALIQARLLVVDENAEKQPVIEVAHEALFAHWERLRDWLADDKLFLLFHEEVRADAAKWQHEGQDASYLYSGKRLEDAEKWRGGYESDLSSEELVFLDACREQKRLLDEREAEVEQERQQRKAMQEAEQKRQEAILQRNRRLRRLVGITAVASPIIVLLMYGIFNLGRLSATQQAASALAPQAAFPARTAKLGFDDADLSAAGFDYEDDIFQDGNGDPGVYRAYFPGGTKELPPFNIDWVEVNYRQYRLCVEAGFCSRPDIGFDEGMDDHPVTGVTAYQAAHYCEWLGRRLPTEEEWESAARGTEGRRYPWGNTPPPSITLVNALFFDAPPPTGTVGISQGQDGSTPDFILHMLGNVWEWTATPLECTSSYSCDTVWDGKSEVEALYLRGLSWRDDISAYDVYASPLTYSFAQSPSFVNDTTGFRCASS
jgi:formylglycine-generating enzyme required for sulfatase activity